MEQLQFFDDDEHVQFNPTPFRRKFDPTFLANLDFSTASFELVELWLYMEPYADRPGFAFFDRDREMLE